MLNTQFLFTERLRPELLPTLRFALTPFLVLALQLTSNAGLRKFALRVAGKTFINKSTCNFERTERSLVELVELVCKRWWGGRFKIRAES